MNSTFYEKLGGEKAVYAAVELFYKKVLADSRINYFFEGLDMERQRKMMKNFLTYAFGGPNQYDGRTLRAAHAHLVKQGLNDSHFEAVIEHLYAALKERGVDENLIKNSVHVAEGAREDVLGK